MKRILDESERAVSGLGGARGVEGSLAAARSATQERTSTIAKSLMVPC